MSTKPQVLLLGDIVQYVHHHYHHHQFNPTNQP